MHRLPSTCATVLTLFTALTACTLLLAPAFAQSSTGPAMALASDQIPAQRHSSAAAAGQAVGDTRAKPGVLASEQAPVHLAGTGATAPAARAAAGSLSPSPLRLATPALASDSPAARMPQ